MIKIPIGVDANGNMVYVCIMELDQRFSSFNNIQTKTIKEARIKLSKQKGAIVF